MNTPGHLVLNFAILGSGKKPRNYFPIAIASILPDIPIFIFYIYQRYFLDMPDILTWGVIYYSPEWQDLFDLFHSFPIAVAGFLIFQIFGFEKTAIIFAAIGMHSVFDIFVHAEDAHRHFFPFIGWRFESPVSYWNPRHFGLLGAAIEIILVSAAALIVFKRDPAKWIRYLLTLILLFYFAGTILLVLFFNEVI